jgi:NhaA family Na+:H+ antiporter
VKLVVGLGNPGSSHADTRHNAGFRIVECLADRLGLVFEPRDDARVATGCLHGASGDEIRFALLEPWTFMNRSGGPTAAWFEALGGRDPASELLVICDDLDLPLGQLRLRKRGGDGGHNGLRDVIASLGTRDFPRLRFGIGRPAAGQSVLDHVLAPFDPAERSHLDARLGEAAEAARVVLSEGIEVAMNRFNRAAEASSNAPTLGGVGREPAIKCADSPDDPPGTAGPVRPVEPAGLREPEAEDIPGMNEASGSATSMPPRLAERIARPFIQFMELEIGSAVLLLAMTALALLWANSPFAHSYEHLLHEPVAIAFGSHALSLSVHHWINDGLMAIFFFLVGMEIKREMVMGDLSTRSRAMLPVMAALGGMIFPAGIYAAFHWGGPAIRGWGIPMATDIAFAVAAMSVLGSRVPSSLKVFLLALAIADDLGAVTVIAVFYTETIHLGALGWAVGLLLLVAGMAKAGVRAFLPYWVVGAVVWFFTHESGIHATIAGVALGLMTPAWPDRERQSNLADRARDALDHLREWVHRHEEDRGGHERHHAVRTLQDATRDSLSPLDYLTNRLERPVLFLIMPLFALANAGVALKTDTLSNPLAREVALAVVLGLVIGKPIGITLFSWLSVKTGLAEMPRGVNLLALFATGMLAGIGFTVALFIAALSFATPTLVDGAKLGILVGSVLAAVVGLAALARALPPEPIS